jgi:hypothetical protein
MSKRFDSISVVILAVIAGLIFLAGAGIALYAALGRH